jgi:uncharacterized protein YjdB
MKSRISSGFKDSPSYQEVNINSSPTLTGVWIIDNSEVRDSKEILSQTDNPIYAGDIVFWEGQNWLIVVKDDMTDVYHKGAMSKCLAPLKWLNANSLPQETWFTFRSDNLTNFGVDQGRYLDVTNERRHLLIPSNIESFQIAKDKRFIIDNRAWKVVAVDRLKQGLIYLVLQETEISAADNLIDGIADYHGSIANYSVTILNGENFSIQANQTLQLFAEVKNYDAIVERNIIWSTSDPAIATVNESGILSAHANGSVTVKATLEIDPNVYDTATVTAQFTVVDNYSIELDGTLDIINGMSKTYTATVKNNLIVDNTKTVQFYLYAEDGVSPPIAASMPFNSTTQCTLKSNAIGKVKLKVVLTGIFPVYHKVFEINIKSLL